MSVLRINNYLDGYRLRAQSEDVHEISGRSGRNSLTEFVNRRILEAIQPGPDDVLIDIGCGDGSLLRMNSGLTRQSIGIVSTPEEQQRLASAYPDLVVKAGTLASLPVESGIATRSCAMAFWHTCRMRLR